MACSRTAAWCLRPARTLGLAALLALAAVAPGGGHSARAEVRGFEELGYVGGPFRAVVERDGLAYVASGDALVIGTPEQLAAGDCRARIRPGVAIVADVALAGDTALLAAGPDGLWLVDVTVPSEPRIVSNVPVVGFAASVAVDGHTAYVAAHYGGLAVVDITDPALPRLVAAATTSYPASRVVVRGGHAFVVVGLHRFQNGLEIVDVRDRTAPRIVAAYSCTAVDVAVGDTHAFIATRSGLDVIEVRDPAAPVPVLKGWFAQLRTVALAGDVLWAVRGEAGWWPALVALDVSAPGEPVELGSVALWSGGSLPGSHYWWWWARLTLVGNRAWLAAGVDMLWRADIDQPAHPVVLSTPITVAGGTQLTAAGALAIAADQDASLRVVDLADVARPRVTGGHRWSWETCFACDPRGGRSASAYGYTYLASEQGLEVLDLADPAAPRLVTRVPDTAAAHDVAIGGRHAYVVGFDHNGTPAAPGGARLTVLDLDRPVAPVVVAQLRLRGAWPDPPSGDLYPERITLDGGVAYISGGRAGIAAVSVAHPAAPRLLSNLVVPNAWAVGIAAANGQAWTGSKVWADLSTSQPGERPPVYRGPSLWALGALDPASPCLAGAYDDYIPQDELARLDATGALAVRGQTGFLALGQRGLVALDLGDPAKIVATGSWRPPGAVADVVVEGGLVYVLTAGYANREWSDPSWPGGLTPSGGLYVLRWHEPASSHATGLSPADLRLRQALPFRVYLSGLRFQRCQ